MTQIEELKKEVDALQKDLTDIKKNTADLLEAWQDAKGALKALAVLGSIAKWIITVASAASLLYLFITGKK